MTVSEAKHHLGHIVDSVADRRDTVMITRRGRPAAVVIGRDELQSLLATLDVLSDSNLAVQLEHSKCAMRRAPLYRLEDLFPG